MTGDSHGEVTPARHVLGADEWRWWVLMLNERFLQTQIPSQNIVSHTEISPQRGNTMNIYSLLASSTQPCPDATLMAPVETEKSRRDTSGVLMARLSQGEKFLYFNNYVCHATPTSCHWFFFFFFFRVERIGTEWGCAEDVLKGKRSDFSHCVVATLRYSSILSSLDKCFLSFVQHAKVTELCVGGPWGKRMGFSCLWRESNILFHPNEPFCCFI